MANNVFASRYTARQVEEALEKAMSAVRSINGQTPGVDGDVFVEALKLQKGDPASVDETHVAYVASPSGRDVPAGPWTQAVPAVPQGEYLWTRVTVVFNSGEPVVFYSVSRMGMDGHGSVAAVNGVSPGSDGDVALTAQDVGALPASGGAMTGGIDMAGQPLTGLSAPTADADGVNKGYADAVRSYATGLQTRNLLDNSDFTNPVNQRGQTSYAATTAVKYTIDRWVTGLSVELNGESVVFSNPADSNRVLYQRFEVGMISPGKKYTLGYCKADGTVAVSSAAAGNGEYGVGVFNSDNIRFAIGSNINNADVFAIAFKPGASIDLKWAALYEGEYTLETLPPYVPKGYAAEAAECYRYYVKSEENNAWWRLGFATKRGYFMIPMQTPVPMRKKPSLESNGTIGIFTGSGWKEINANIFTIIVDGNTHYLQSNLTALAEFSLEEGMSYLVRTLPSLSADL